MISTLLPLPLAGTCSWPSSKGGLSPNKAPPPLLHPEPHPLDSSTLQGTGAGMATCPAPTLVRVPWALTKFSSVTGSLLWLPRNSTSLSPSLTQGIPPLSPEPCSSLAPQSQALTTSPLQSLPFPHSRNTALGPLPTSLAFVTLSLVPRPQWALTISILYPKSLFMPLGQQAFPTGSLLPGSPHAYWLSDPNPLWRCDLTPSNPSHHVGASSVHLGFQFHLLLPLRHFNSP